jgi:ubiquinone/menaquinone biosynthesis C-methylase UbiE
MTNHFISNKKKFFDLWAPSYDWLFLSVFYQAVHKRLLEYVYLPDQPYVLDLGCGTGRLLERLANQFHDLRGIGLDLSTEMLRVARRNNHHHPRLIYIEGRAESLPFASSQFDAVFNTISFLHYAEPQQVFAEVARVLNPGGRFYLVDSTVANQAEQKLMALTKGGIKLYSPTSREHLGICAGLLCLGHYYLLGPVLLTVFTKPPLG